MAKQDIIFIEGLTIETTIGVHDWERQIKQKIIFDIEVSSNTEHAAAEDQLSLTVNYQKLSNMVIEFTENTAYSLVETLANRVATLIFDNFETNWLRLTLKKPSALPNTTSVGITIERTKPLSKKT